MNEPNVRYSVIVPHYDDAARLRRLLLSIPPERQDIQVIVIDDCSSDQASLGRVKSEFLKILWLSTTENQGAGAARNIGIDCATGHSLVFADSDDEFLPGAFEIFDEEISSDNDLTYFLAEAVQEVTGARSNRADAMNDLCLDYLRDPSSDSEERLRVRHGNPCPKVYRREFILDRDLRHQESIVANDTAFNVMAGVKAKNLAAVSRYVYRIYRRVNSLTDHSPSDRFLERVRVKADLASWLKDNGIGDLPSGTGELVMSVRLGPVVFWKVAQIIFSSDLSVRWEKALSPLRWSAYVARRIKTRREQNAART